MIFVDGLPFFLSTHHQSSSGGIGTLVALLEHPSLVAAVNLFKAIPEAKYSTPEQFSMESSLLKKHVYVFQREYATVDSAFVDSVGTDEATTCVGLAIRNPKTGMTSIAHFDFPGVVDFGLTQMLSLVVDNEIKAALDVHLVGGFDDAPNEYVNGIAALEKHIHSGGYSLPLCAKIVEALQSRHENFHIRTVCVLGHNTRRDSSGAARPFFNGFLVETCNGSIRPASFDRSSRCPDEVVRRLRLTVSSRDPKWDGKLLETYDTHHDRLQIAPCSWHLGWKSYALSMLQYCDSEFLLKFSTSPSVEGPDFVDNERRMFEYLVKHPDWRQTFPKRKPRVFNRAPNGGWIRIE